MRAIIPGKLEMSDIIDTPDIGYLLSMPFFELVPVDYARKVGARFQKKLIDASPIIGDKKNILVSSRVHMLYPGYSPILNRTGHTFEWHIDGNADLTTVLHGGSDRCHIFMNECTALTEFNVRDIKIDTDDFNDDIATFNKYLNNVEFEKELRKAEPNRFVTFENNIHRSTSPLSPEFRFFFSVIESDHTTSYGSRTSSYSLIYKGQEQLSSIRKEGNAVIIDIPEWED